MLRNEKVDKVVEVKVIQVGDFISYEKIPEKEIVIENKDNKKDMGMIRGKK